MDSMRKIGKSYMTHIAKWLAKISNGHISPNQVTIASLLLHVPIFFVIIAEYDILAALLIVIFGLMDSIDGALARVQGRESTSGMLLDATTDRMKEALIFMAFSYRYAIDGNEWAVLASVAAITGSMLVSYVKAKGETALKDSKLSVNEINRIFQSGLMRYEVRMLVIVIGLLFGVAEFAIAFVAITTWATAFYRLITISRKIDN